MSRGWCAGIAGIALFAAPAAATPLQIALTGTIPASCGLSGVPETLDLGSLDGGGQEQAHFTVDCNAPFAWSVAAAHGALVPDTAVVFVGTFEDRIPYTLRLELPLADGAPAAIDVTCSGAELADPAAGCGSGDSGSAVAMGETARLTVAWPAPAAPRLAGRHVEVLTLEVRVRP